MRIIPHHYMKIFCVQESLFDADHFGYTTFTAGSSTTVIKVKKFSSCLSNK